ncbi:M56 family metallopeptidase [Winogradskyella sp. Asnod2-B02-A]|uniref:M56 family metallopeptidase n=1 Tax=Winogradskyella sp. Asnod2-B02-A TaxID=3160583 RepID=UPI00386ED3AD
MEIYVLKLSACLFVFWLVYVLFLERQNMHHFKRFYLLGALATALIIPTLTITEYIEPIVNDLETAPLFIPIESSFVAMPIEETDFIDLETTLWLIYGIGVLLFSIRFLINIVKMQRRIYKNENINNRSFIYVLLQENLIPHSFFKYIFFNKTRYESNNIPKEVMLHEETHAKQLHSLDIIILELLQIAFWFHPLIYILKHHVKLNHEFLADQAVLQQGSDAKTYQNILLQFSSNTQNHQLSSAINYSSIKKRFTVMKTQTSKTRVWLSTLLVLPIIAILFYSFAEKQYVEKETLDIVDAIKEELIEANDYNIQYVDGATKKLMQEYRDFIKEYSETNTIFSSKYERAVIIYDQLMSDHQRSTVKKYPKRFIPEPNLSKTKPKKPSSSQFEAFKNAEKYAIWINGKPVPNSILSNYSVNDFVHYSGSTVYKNARSKKFPQPNQYHLYTKSGFKKTYQDSQLNRYNKATETYSNAISKYLNGAQTDNSELRIIKAQADKIYKLFTKEEKEKYNILPVPPVPAQQVNYNSQEKPIMIILVNRKGQLLVDDELGSIKSIESKLKKLSKSFDNSRAVYIKYDGTENSYKIIKEVKSLIKKYDFKIIQSDASQIAPPPPPVKQKTSKGGPNPDDNQSIYNPSFLEYIVEMEKEGASFYLDDEKITANKAKSIATNNKGKRTEMTTQKDSDGNYMVKLSSAEKKKIYARSISLKVLKNGYYFVDGINATKSTFVDVFNQLHQDITPEQRNNYMNIHVSSANEISNKEMWFIYNSLQDYGFYRIVAPNQEIIRAKGNTPFAIESHFSAQEKPSAKQIAEYNTWAKKINTAVEKAETNSKTYPVIKLKDIEKHKHTYNLMTTEQKKNAEPFPNFPPPPPPPPATENAKFGPIEINGASYYYTHQNGKTTYYDRYGKMVDINKIPPPPPIPNDATPEQKAKMQKATDAYMKANPDKVGTAKSTDGEIFEVIEIPEDLQGSVDINGETFYYTTSHGKTTYFNRYGKEVKMDNLPPVQSKNPSFLEYIEDMEKQGATFYLDNKKITAKEAKSIAIKSKGKSTEMLSQLDDSGKYVVKLSSPKEKKAQESILPMVNGKTFTSRKIPMTRDDIKAIKLTTKNGKVTEFKFKIPGKPTQTIKSNTLNVDALKNLESAKKDDHLALFAIKDSTDSEISPLIVIITD